MSDEKGEDLTPERHLKPVTQDGFDPFNFEAESKYDPNEFYVRTVDKRGHKETVHVAMPPDLFAEIHETANNPNFPFYRTVQDLMRDAVLHRMHWLYEKYGATEHAKEFLALEMAKAKIETRKRARDTITDILSELTTSLDIYIKVGDHKNLAKCIFDCYEMAETTTEPYSSQFRSLAQQYESRK